MTEPLVYNLLPGQYQLEDVIFGKHTTVPVEIFDPKAYDVEAQDFQTSRSDEIRFGQDRFKPSVIELTFSVINNKMRKGKEHLKPDFWKHMPKVEDFKRIWRFDSGRRISGSMMPFYFGSKDKDRDGNYITKVFFGRPGQITIPKDDNEVGEVKCLAQFRCVDTMSYSSKESFTKILQQEEPTYIYRDPDFDGEGDSALRIIAKGPITNPKFTIGNKTIQVQTSLAEGEVMEISSYPWLRRIINEKRENLSANIIGSSQYLDQLRIPAGTMVPVRWTSDEINTFVPDLGNQQWQEDINDIKTGLFHQPPVSKFNVLTGIIRVQNFSNIFSSQWYKQVLTAGAWAGTSACIYKEQKFASDSQRVRVQVAPPFWGQSAIVFKSNSTMTNFAALEVQCNFGALGTAPGNWLRIRTGISPVSTTVRAEWQNTSLFGWSDDDYIEIGYDEETKRYSAYFNDEEVCHWIDTDDIVVSGPSNREQGFIFNLKNNFWDVGVGFRNILCYDTAVVPAPQGEVYLLWRDAWLGIQ